MAKFLLASSFDYKKTEKREVDAEIDTDLTVTPEEKEQLAEAFEADPQ